MMNASNNTSIDPINIEFVPYPIIKNPPILVPIVIPIFVIEKNIPLANSGASGAADVIQYCKILFKTPSRAPHIITRIIVGIFTFPII